MSPRELNQRLAEVRQANSLTKRHFLETELSLVSTLIDLARRRYQSGNRRDGDECNVRARLGIETVRRFIGTADLNPAGSALFARRCNEFERAVTALTGGRR